MTQWEAALEEIKASYGIYIRRNGIVLVVNKDGSYRHIRNLLPDEVIDRAMNLSPVTATRLSLIHIMNVLELHGFPKNTKENEK